MNEAQLRMKMIKKIITCGRPARARTVHAGPHSGTVGEPDIDAVIDGISVKIEVKLPGRFPTKLQEQVIRQWRAVGCVAGWADDMESLMVLVDEALYRAEVIRREMGVTGNWWESSYVQR